MTEALRLYLAHCLILKSCISLHTTFFSADSGKFVSPEERMTRMKRIEAACLQELGVVQLKLWLDQDQEAVDVRVSVEMRRVCYVCAVFVVHRVRSCIDIVRGSL